ncbi:MAG: hypothetical protein U5R06_16005 [candidate division KSB1 bacterium]|nr:hypothetical protein [candidate division KSB1 bacterium]
MQKQNIKELVVKEADDLSPDILNEVLDFIHFLKLKHAFENKGESLEIALKELYTASMSHLDEEFADYKTDYPHE